MRDWGVGEPFHGGFGGIRWTLFSSVVTISGSFSAALYGGTLNPPDNPMEIVDGPLLWVVYVALGLMGVSILGALLRVLWGPSLADRVIALDLVAYLSMGFLTVYAILMGEDTYIDAALVLGLLAFLGTIAVGRYIERVRSGESLLQP